MPSNSSSDSDYDPNSRPDPEIVLKLSLDMDIVWSRFWIVFITNFFSDVFDCLRVLIHCLH